MAKGNIIRWITVKGRRIPIYEDGSMGGFMEGKQVKTKHYAVYQPSNILGTEHHTRLERIEASSEEEAVRKYKEKYPNATDENISLQRTTENGSRYQNEDGSWDDGHPYKKAGKNESKSLEDHSDIQKIAEEHVKKIWNGGAANRELYDAADKWAEEHNFDKTKVRDAAFAAMNKKQMAEIAKREKAEGFSAEAAAKDINAISMSHNNRGGDTKNDWKKVRDTLEAAPAGTVMIETGDRGAKYQFTKGEDGQGHGSWDSDSKTLSMGWVGQGTRPEVEFTTPDKALSSQQIKDTQTAAVNGKLNQQLGLDKNGYKIGNRSTPKVDVPEKSIKIGDKEVGVSKDPHAAEKIASAKKMVSNNESNLAGLRDQLKKHPNDEHTAEIKAAIKKAEGRVKDSKNTLAEREGKSINVGGKKIGVNKGKTPSIRDIVGSDGEYQIGKAYTKSNMMDIAEMAGIPRSKTSKMTVAELRKMMLAMWRKG